MHRRSRIESSSAASFQIEQASSNQRHDQVVIQRRLASAVHEAKVTTARFAGSLANPFQNVRVHLQHFLRGWRVLRFDLKQGARSTRISKKADRPYLQSSPHRWIFQVLHFVDGSETALSDQSNHPPSILDQFAYFQSLQRHADLTVSTHADEHFNRPLRTPDSLPE